MTDNDFLLKRLLMARDFLYLYYKTMGITDVKTIMDKDIEGLKSKIRLEKLKKIRKKI